MKIINYGNSYVRWSSESNMNDTRKPGHMKWGNNVRIQLDASCAITNIQSDQTVVYYLISPCRTEWMYRDDTLFQKNSREFCQIISATTSRSVGFGITSDEDRDPIHGRSANNACFELNHFTTVNALQSDDAIVHASQLNHQIIGRTEFRDRDNKFSALIEYPIKTLNYNPTKTRFQVDTGPILFPDFTREATDLIDHFYIAHIVYNTFDWAEFILRKPTPILINNKEVSKVDHYSDIQRLDVQNQLFETG